MFGLFVFMVLGTKIMLDNALPLSYNPQLSLGQDLTKLPKVTLNLL